MSPELSALRARYGELTPIGPAPEGRHYAAALPDGTPVTVVALRHSLGAHIRDGDGFARELKRVSAVRHEEISRAVSWGCDDGVFHCGYFRSEMHGVEPGAYPSSEVAAIGARLARALHASHEMGVMHGGISTQRLRLAANRSPRLTSLGLVPALIAGGIDVRAVYSDVCDSLYLSPEQLEGDAPSVRSDIYALGATLYELLTGKAPFGGRTTSFVLATVLPDEPTSGADESTNADIVIHALLRAIEHAADDRWANAGAFADALDAANAAELSPSVARSAPSSGLRYRIGAIFRGAWFPAGRSRE
jgi:serine/threonine protein kinase